MEKGLYHQSQNTDRLLITSYPYDYNHWEFGALHFHKNYELLVAVRSSFDTCINRRQYTLQEGDAVLIQPFQIHNLHVHDGALVWCSTFSKRYFESIAALLADKCAECPVFHPDAVVTAFYLDRIEKFIGRRKSLTAFDITKLQECVFKSCVYAMGSAFLEQVTLIPAPTSVDEPAVNVARYIDHNFKTDITLAEAAKQLGYNYQYLSKIFNQTFGVSFKQMLNRYRLEYAITLLKENTLSIAEIAYESGFQSMRSFDHACREHLQKTPKEIRREQKK
jgi:AraC-like DNA-binding protein